MATEGGAAKKMMVGAHPMSPIGNTAAPFDVDTAGGGGAVASLTKKERGIIADRCDKTARKPWYVHETDRDLLVRDRDGNAVCRVSDIAFATPKQRRYAAFIAHARTDVPALLAALAAAERQRDAAADRAQAFADRLVAAEGERDELRAALVAVKEWADALTPNDGIKYGAYWPSYAVNAALTGPPEAQPEKGTDDGQH